MNTKIYKKIKSIKNSLLAYDLNAPALRYFLLTFFLSMLLIYTGSILVISHQFKNLVNIKINKLPTKLERTILKMVSGYPMEKMTSQIANRDPKVAMYLVAIAKKESNWGKYSPKSNGRECFNYWGYRGSYKTTNSGYSCFDTPAQAVRVVGNRIEELISQQIDTPSEMVVWKCGWNCSVFSSSSVNKWISDVNLYVNKMENS